MSIRLGRKTPLHDRSHHQRVQRVRVSFSGRETGQQSDGNDYDVRDEGYPVVVDAERHEDFGWIRIHLIRKKSQELVTI